MDERIYYHYCSVDTFFNIIQTSTLRLGNPLSMNDSAEILWFLELVEAYAIKKGKYQKTLEKWEQIENIIKSIIQEIDFPYILCLSKENDVLSQWRSYADDGQGVAIGINVDQLLAYSNLLSGKDIIYDLEKQMELLDGKEIDSCLDNLEKEIDRGKENLIYNKVRILVSYLLEDSMICKNPAFREEREYRISCPFNDTDLDKISEVKFRTNNKHILPYREICFKNCNHKIIENITIGPKSLLNDRNLWLFLKENKFKWLQDEKHWSRQDAKWLKHIKISKATYR